jgi:hypothetical protein
MIEFRLPPRVRLAACLLSAATLLPASSAFAQTCLGNATFDVHPVRIGGSVSSGNDVTDLGLNVNFGQRQGAFGGVGVGLSQFDDDVSSEDATTITGSLGYQVPLGTTPRRGGPQVCPIGVVGYTIGPDVGNIDTRVLTLQGGFAIGAPVTLTPAVRLSPFGALSLVHQRLSISDEDDNEFDDSESGGLLNIGAGLIFNDRFTIRPSIDIPLGFDGSDTGFTLSLGLSFGGPR